MDERKKKIFEIFYFKASGWENRLNKLGVLLNMKGHIPNAPVFLVTERAVPKKRFSQNFLIDINLAQKIVDALGIQEGDVVLEVGCGRGALTKRLLETPARVVGVEVDRSLTPALRSEFGGRLELHEADILEVDPGQLGLSYPTKLIGNLPYHISSPILFRLMEWKNVVSNAVIMVQKEVARRIVAASGSKTYGILSVFCRYHADCSLLFDVPPGAFFPRPKVTSSIVSMRLRPFHKTPQDETRFRQVVRRAFNQRRKMLRNSLAGILNDRSLPFDMQQRPEDLTVEAFIQLSDMLQTS